MDHLFGKLRSTLHSDPPSKKTWRSITQLFYPDHTKRRADLVPYADELLDRTWPDAMRPAPLSWIKQLRDTGEPHQAWPLVRALRAVRAHAGLDPLLSNDHLARITHISAQAQHPALDLDALLHAPALRKLASLDCEHSRCSPAAIHAMLTQHPTLQTLRMGFIGLAPSALPTPDLPALRSLHLSQHTSAMLSPLLHAAALPSLADLKTWHAPAPQLLAQLRSLTLYARDLATLRALDDAPRLDHLTLHCASDEAHQRALAGLQTPAPRALTLHLWQEAPATNRAPDGWRLLDGVEELTLIHLRHAAPLLLRLLDLPMRASLRSLALHYCDHTSTDALARALTASPWPALHTLHIERTHVNGLGTDPAALARAFPALRRLIIRCSHLTDQDVRAIIDAPWFAQLETLDINSSYYMRDQDTSHPIIAALDGHRHLRHLGLCSSGIHPAHLAQLAQTDLPSLQILRLGKVSEARMDHIAPLSDAPWLPQLRWLRLKLRGDAYRWRYHPSTAPLRYLNLRAYLTHHGLPRSARVVY